MRFFKNIMVFIPLIIVSFACRRPQASFTTDKTEYYSGETIHLINTSDGGHSYKWILPDGTISNTKNLDYVTNPDDNGGLETITLEAFFLNGQKHSSAIKTVTINQAILESDYYSMESTNGVTILYKPSKKTSWLDNSQKHWVISAYRTGCSLGITFPDPTRVVVGTYSVQSSGILNPNCVFLSISQGNYDSQLFYIATTGSVEVISAANGKVRVVFKDLDAYLTRVPTLSYKISGDITVY